MSADEPKNGLTAALQTSASIRPNAFIVALTSFSNSSLWEMLQGMATAVPSPWAALISAATLSQASALRLETTTLAPCSAMRLTMASPIPLVEPVTRATLPVRSKSDMEFFLPVGAYQPVRQAVFRAHSC